MENYFLDTIQSHPEHYDGSFLNDDPTENLLISEDVVEFAADDMVPVNAIDYFSRLRYYDDMV